MSVDVKTGATGASPSSSSGAIGSSPATVGDTSRKDSPASGSDQDDRYGQKFWDEHGDGIFRHERFKELNSFKKRYEEVQPTVEFVNQMGGYDQLREFYNHLGPVFQNMNQDYWSTLYPVFQDIIANKDISGRFSKAQVDAMTSAVGGDVDDSDPYIQKLKPLEQQIQEMNKKLSQHDQEKMTERQQKIQEHRQNNYQGYTSMLTEKFNDPNSGVPKDFLDVAGMLIVNNIGNFMPRDPSGNPRNPLDHFSQEAFNGVWEKVVVPTWRKMQNASLSSAKTTVENGGPVLPDSSGGKTPATRQQPFSRQEKVARMAQMLSR